MICRGGRGGAMLQEHLHDLLEHAVKRLHNAPFLDLRALVERDLLAAEASVGDVTCAAVWDVWDT
jgi:hypothetical protein